MKEEDEDFLKSCDMYIHTYGLKIITENDEGAYLMKEDIIRLSNILKEYGEIL